jgi:hypothetical protein
MRITWSVAALALALLGWSPVAASAQGGAGGQRRALLEQRVRERFAQVVRQHVGLDDEQMGKLGAVNQRFEARRRELVGIERQLRLDLRDELMAGERADQDRVAKLVEQALRVQRERLDLVEREQKELAAFMTPVQRAKYLAVQDRIRRTMDDMRRGERRPGPLAPRGQGRRLPPP